MSSSIETKLDTLIEILERLDKRFAEKFSSDQDQAAKTTVTFSEKSREEARKLADELS